MRLMHTRCGLNWAVVVLISGPLSLLSRSRGGGTGSLGTSTATVTHLTLRVVVCVLAAGIMQLASAQLLLVPMATVMTGCHTPPTQCGVAAAGGRYCPNTTAMLDCPEGHSCKVGSSKVTACPPLLGCPAHTEAPLNNWLGFALDGAMFLLLALTWQAMQLYNQIMRRLSRRERMKVMWNSRTNVPEVRACRMFGHASNGGSL